MIISYVLVTIGLAIGVWGAYTRGFRLGGVVVLPLVVVYTLLNVSALPVFVMSTLLAYIGLGVVQQRRVLYGRQLLLAAVLLGAVIPVGTYLAVSTLVGNGSAVAEITFLGSILPGIAAYNLYRQDPSERWVDLLVTGTVVVGLAAAGLVATLAWVRPPCWSCSILGVEPAAYVTPILLQEGTDTVALLGVSARAAESSLGTVPTVFTVVILGLILGEWIRARWGFRPLGVISLPVVALFSLRAWWILPLYLLILGVTYAWTTGVHHLTYVYGRALLSVAIVVGIGAVLGVQLILGLPYGLSLFFTGLLAGIGAYNLHVMAPNEQPATLAVSAGYFVVIGAVARVLIDPFPEGIATTITAGHGLVVALALLAACWAGYRQERRLPSTAALRDGAPVDWRGEDR